MLPIILLPALSVIAIYAVAAVLPAILLMRYIYRQDHVEKEPIGLLLQLLVMGVLSALCAVPLEGIGSRLLQSFSIKNDTLYTTLFAFLVVAAVEEATKFFFLKWRTWHNPNFNYQFDAIVYSVFVSLGFAAYENILYVLQYGLSVALPRALLAVPGHMSFAIFMGVFYGRAKRFSLDGRPAACRASLIWGYLVAVFHHGFYDACAMNGSAFATALFLIFVVLMYLRVRHLVRRESIADQPI